MHRLDPSHLRVVALLLVCLLLVGTSAACSTPSVPASSDPKTPADYDTSTVLAQLATAASAAPVSDEIRAACLVNLENDLTLYEKNTDQVLYPASTVKITAGLLACRALENRLDEAVTLTDAMLGGSKGRQLYLQIGETVTIRDLLYAAVCGGYNDAMLALACCSHGSVASFVEAMNAEAVRVGATSTHYTNPTGLHEDAMVSSVADTVRLAREAAQSPLYMEVSSAPSYEIPATNHSEARHFSNRNALVNNTNRSYYNGYCRGMSAGYTDEGGWCVVSLWERGGASNLCVIMGGSANEYDSAVPAYAYANRLFEWAHSEFSYRTVVAAGQSFDTVKVGLTGTSKSKTDLVAAADLSLYLPRSLSEDLLSTVYRLHEDELNAPVAAGQEIGFVTVSVAGQPDAASVLGTVPLTVKDSFEINPFLESMSAFRSYLGSRTFMATVVCFTILLLIYLKWISTPGGRYGVRHTGRRTRYKRRR